MKVRIDWTNAPEWARYLTTDARGSYVWCEQLPRMHEGSLVAGRTQIAQEYWDTFDGTIHQTVPHVCA
jgi:hypothetical protein